MANKVEVKELLEAGVHFGHMTRKWDPNMAPYIYMERNGTSPHRSWRASWPTQRRDCS